jgi:hypothetical protein
MFTASLCPSTKTLSIFLIVLLAISVYFYRKATEAAHSSMDKGLPNPSFPPSSVDWENYRPIITQLYFNENKKLEDVRKHMFTRHKFKATPRMYKKRTLEWGLRKYRTLKTRNNDDNDGWVIVNRPRLRRNQEPQASNAQNEAHDGARMANMDIALAFSIHPSATNIDAILFYAREQAMLCVDDIRRAHPGTSLQILPETDYVSEIHKLETDEGGAFHSGVIQGCFLMREKRYQEAFAQFQTGCHRMIPYWKSIRTRPRLVLPNLIQLFGSRKCQWENFPDVRQELLSYLARTATVILGNLHPISRVLQYLRAEDLYTQVDEGGIVRAILDSFEHTLDPGHPQVSELRQDLETVLTREGRLMEGAAVLQRGVEHSERFNGTHHWQTLELMQNLAVVHMTQGSWGEAIDIYREVVMRLDVDRLETPPDLSGVADLTNLLHISDSRTGGLDQWVQDTNSSSHPWGIKFERTKQCLSKLGFELWLYASGPGRENLAQKFQAVQGGPDHQQQFALPLIV